MKTLPEIIAAHLATPFKWGEFDCVTLASIWVSVCTGKNPLEGLPAWSSEAEAMAVIESVGGLEAALDARFWRIQPNFACDGDLCLHDGAVMIFSGHQIVGPGARGLQFLGREVARLAWRVA